MLYMSTHQVEVGTIFKYEWGYEQTNVEFWEVVDSTHKSVWIRRIDAVKTPDGNAHTGARFSKTCEPDPYDSEKGPSFTGWTVPVPGAYNGMKIRRLVRHHRDGSIHLDMPYGFAYPAEYSVWTEGNESVKVYKPVRYSEYA
jgi:hypothetical protein